MKSLIIAGGHSPDQFRVLGPLSNLAEFSADYKCPKGSTMNPIKKCEIWLKKPISKLRNFLQQIF